MGQFSVEKPVLPGSVLTGNQHALDSEQPSLKILANSTSYGIFVAMNVTDLDTPEKLACYGPDGEGFPVESNKVEEPGRFFHPLLATLIRGSTAAQTSLPGSIRPTALISPPATPARS
jgi:hypothetical protein